MGRKRLDPDDRKEFVGIRLPAWLLNQIKTVGKPQQVIEKILKDKFKKK